jgi:hypothetical protein
MIRSDYYAFLRTERSLIESLILMKSPKPKIILLLLVVIVAAWPVRWYLRSRRFNNGFLAVPLGDSKESVRLHLGEPGAIENCPHPEDENELQKVVPKSIGTTHS